VLGFGINYETGAIQFEGCVCAEASVNLADVAILIGTGLYGGVRSNLIKGLQASSALWSDRLAQLLEQSDRYWTVLAHWEIEIGWAEQVIDYLRRRMADGEFIGLDPRIDLPPGVIDYVNYEDVINELRDAIDRAYSGSGGITGRAKPGWRNYNWMIVQMDKLVARIEWVRKHIADLEKQFIDILSIADPTALFTAFAASYIPIKFVVPKECGYPFVLNAACECVADEGSGSGE